jgi:DNA helicase-2/ATP-dependent DNA helicase PcrA
MRILVNPGDELAWRRLLLMYPKIGKITFEKIWKYLSKEENPLEAIFSDEFIRLAPKIATIGLEECRKTINLLLELNTPDRTPENVIDVLLNKSDYRTYLQDNYSNGSSREEDLIHLGSFSAKFERMEDFLNELALLTNMAKDEYSSDQEKVDKVVLSTIHQAKGLEWSYVFLIWCADGMIPLQRALKEPGGEEEERRLFYVALTRAKDQLYMCYPALDYTRSSGTMVLVPSRFIREISPLSDHDEDQPFELWSIYDEY